MPRKPIDYSKAIIYKIVCNDLNVKDIYVGHTTNFVKRKAEHKLCCRNLYQQNSNCKVYKAIRDNGGWENWSMVEIEKYPCNDHNEAVARERYHFEQLNATLNAIFPTRSKEEHYYNNKGEYQKRAKLYYQNNKDAINTRQKQRFICSCGSTINWAEKAAHYKTQKHQQYLNSQDEG